MSMSARVLVIGAGPAGLEASTLLAQRGYQVTLVEESDTLGGKINSWDRLFPNQRHASEVVKYLNNSLLNIDIKQNAKPDHIIQSNGVFQTRLSNGETIETQAILVATGFRVFEAVKKEEYGYGIYDHVITSADLEFRFSNKNNLILPDGRIPKKIGFVHCVGSRDEKAGVLHCSRVCCVTAVKQAIEIRQALPESQVYCFYMDLRMFGLGYEELYKESQEKYKVQFIRGRLSEAFEDRDGSIMIRIEDTLTARPLRMNLDLLVLMVGMLPSEGTSLVARLLSLELNPNGFLKPLDEHIHAQQSSVSGVFLAGTCKGPKNIEETLADARSAVVQIENYLSKS